MQSKSCGARGHCDFHVGDVGSVGARSDRRGAAPGAGLEADEIRTPTRIGWCDVSDWVIVYRSVRADSDQPVSYPQALK